MKSFDVLDKHQSIRRNALLEASAGTGKTFAIENVVTRFLIECPSDQQQPINIENILIVTFTKAATRDLKERIRQNIDRTLQIFDLFLKENTILKGCPDYLSALLNQGIDKVRNGKRRLQQALFSFDQAQIFTIHGFCWRMLSTYALEGNISLEAKSKEENPQQAILLAQAILDFLRTELSADEYSPEQLKIILGLFKRDLNKLQEDLLKTINRGVDIQPSPTFLELFLKFNEAMLLLKTKNYQEGMIIADFIAQAPLYKGLCNKSKQIKPDNLEMIQRFALLFNQTTWSHADFDRLIADGLFFVEAFDPDNKKVSSKTSSTPAYPELYTDLQHTLAPIVDQARHETSLFARMAYDCQQFIRRYQTEEESIGHNDLLVKMLQAIKQPVFANKVRHIYQAAIIDEFQDTDPTQWEIFATLFKKTEWPGHLYLVGDPKQSIYAFRQADIYTYLAATDFIGEESLATLDTNFRSQPQLVTALNTLFSAVEGLFPLPKISGTLPFREVKAGRQEQRKFCDHEACLHFLALDNSDIKETPIGCEEKYFLPAISNEILRLHNEDRIDFGQCAILVSDRFQAARLVNFLKKCHIPTKNQRGLNLSDTLAVESIREVLDGILHYQQSSALKVALGGQMIGMTHAELLVLNHEESTAVSRIIRLCMQLRSTLIDKGFGLFYTQFMQSSWHSHQQTISEQLLTRENGYEFYRQCQDVADLLTDEQTQNQLSGEGLIDFLDNFERLSDDDSDRFKSYIDPEEDGVSILTTHISKGLEFDVVFTLGLIHRPKNSDKKLILFHDGQNQYLGAVPQTDSRYLQHCREVDAEKMRQLYVASTRAKYRVYMPVIFSNSTSKISYGTASPMELMLARLNQQPDTDYEKMYQNLQTLDNGILTAFVDKYPSLMKLSLLNDFTELSKNTHNLTARGINSNDKSPLLIPPSSMKIPGNPCSIQSFTSLTHHNSPTPYESEEESLVPHAFVLDIKSEHTLPSSNETGILLHHLLEIIPFTYAKEIKESNELLPLIWPAIEKTRFAAWDEVIAKILFQSLKAPLPGIENTFCLADINPKKIYCETEFLFPCDETLAFEGITIRPGYLKGVMDLFFEHEERYYLLDWKSNWLGPTIDYYQPKYLQEAMRKNQYDLQAKLYVEALRRYLKIFDLPFEKVFGGVFYVFLRGVGPSTGIWKS